MHFTTLFILKGEELNNITTTMIKADFCKRFCYCCGDTKPMYQYWCDWFQIGGRWNDSNVLKAQRGFVGENGIGDGYGEPTKSVVEIKDLEEDIDSNMIYAIATKTRIYRCGEEKFNDLLNKINNKKIKGVIALLDCHD